MSISFAADALKSVPTALISGLLIYSLRLCARPSPNIISFCFFCRFCPFVSISFAADALKSVPTVLIYNLLIILLRLCATPTPNYKTFCFFCSFCLFVSLFSPIGVKHGRASRRCTPGILMVCFYYRLWVEPATPLGWSYQLSPSLSIEKSLPVIHSLKRGYALWMLVRSVGHSHF